VAIYLSASSSASCNAAAGQLWQWHQLSGIHNGGSAFIGISAAQRIGVSAALCISQLSMANGQRESSQPHQPGSWQPASQHGVIS